MTVTNIGSVAGSEVVQFYATFTVSMSCSTEHPSSDLPFCVQNSPYTTAHIKLVGFDRVENLSPRAQAVITVSMDPSQMTVCNFVVS